MKLAFLSLFFPCLLFAQSGSLVGGVSRNFGTVTGGTVIEAPDGGGGGGPAIVQTNFTRVLTSVSAPTWTTNTLAGVVSGHKLILCVANEKDSSLFANGVIVSVPSETWTKGPDASAASSGNCEIWTATANSSGTYWVTNTWADTSPNNLGRSATLFEVSGTETTLAGASSAVTAQATPSIALTTTRANSLIFCVVSDWNAKSPPITYRNGGLQAGQDDQSPGTYRADFFYYTTTTVAAYTVGESAPAAQGSGFCALEIRTP